MTIPSLAVHSDVDVIARGAAFAAGLAANVWDNIDCIPQLPKPTIFKPNTTPEGM
jgi:glycerol kinase